MRVITVYICSWGNSVFRTFAVCVYWCWEWRLRQKSVLLQKGEQLRLSGSCRSKRHPALILLLWHSDPMLLFRTKDNPHPVLLTRLVTIALHLSSSCFLLVSAEITPPSVNTNVPTPGTNPAVVMSSLWGMCCGGYAITSAYLSFDSLWFLWVRIRCFSFPHAQSILPLWYFYPPVSWKKWTFLIHCSSLATASSSFTRSLPPPSF